MSALQQVEQGLADWWPAVARLARDPWWVIGSAAAALLGADVEIGDIDLLTSRRDADTLADAWASRRIEVGPRADDDHFRSCFGRYAFTPLKLEVMGDLQVHGADGWQPLHIQHTTVCRLGNAELPVPSLADQLQLLARFDRPKDHIRMRLLQALAESGA